MAADRKEKYALKAMEIFKREGLRLSLDEIAEKIGVTKKTLYNHFSSKEDLLSYCIQGFMLDLREVLHIMTSKDVNAIEGLISGVKEMGDLFRSLSPVFFFDLKKLYPEIAGAEHSTGFGSFLDSVKENMNKGKEEGIFRQEVNVDLISQYFVYSMVGFFLNRVLNNAEFPAGTYFRNILDYHLNAIVTDRGRDILKSSGNKK